MLKVAEAAVAELTRTGRVEQVEWPMRMPWERMGLRHPDAPSEPSGNQGMRHGTG